jgi:5-methylcytosine-specific restriction endonuclease McrA
MGGLHVWENLVTCCSDCNHKKGGKKLELSGMKLLSKPKVPRYTFNYLLNRPIDREDEYWSYYLAAY